MPKHLSAISCANWLEVGTREKQESEVRSQESEAGNQDSGENERGFS
jgi:hypothetical protein